MATVDQVDARYMLSLTLALGMLLLGLQGYYCATGDTKTEIPAVYVIPMLVIVIANIIALVMIRRSILATTYGFCLSVMAAIVFMILAGSDNVLPPIALVMFPICSYGVSYFVTTRQMLPFLTLTVATLLSLGIASGMVENAMPSIIASVIGSIAVSRLRTAIFRLRTELEKLQGAIKVLAERGRDDEEHLRRITEINSH